MSKAINRTQLIAAHVQECINREPMKKREFARLVREHYERSVAVDNRTIDFSTLDDVFDRLEADEAKVFGMLDNKSNRSLRSRSSRRCRSRVVCACGWSWVSVRGC